MPTRNSTFLTCLALAFTVLALCAAVIASLVPFISRPTNALPSLVEERSLWLLSCQRFGNIFLPICELDLCTEFHIGRSLLLFSVAIQLSLVGVYVASLVRAFRWGHLSSKFGIVFSSAALLLQIFGFITVLSSWNQECKPDSTSGSEDVTERFSLYYVTNLSGGAYLLLVSIFIQALGLGAIAVKRSLGTSVDSRSLRTVALTYGRRLFLGGDHGMPDATRLWVLMGCCTVYQDMQYNIFYTALQDSEVGCNLFAKFDILFGVANIFSIPLQLITGLMSDWIGSRAHIFLAMCILTSSSVQFATLFVTSERGLSAMFFTMQLLFQQISVQRFKLLKMRLEAFFGSGDLLRQDHAANHITPVGDTCGSIAMLFTFGMAWYMARRDTPSFFGYHPSRLCLYGLSGTVCVVILVLSLRYKRSDFETSSRRSIPVPNASVEFQEDLDYGKVEPSSPSLESLLPRHKRFARYIVHSAVAVAKNKVALFSLMHVLLIVGANSVVGISLSQSNAEDMEELMEYPYFSCKGMLGNLWLQGIFTQLFYILGGMFYINVLAKLEPHEFHKKAYLLLGSTFICGLLIFKIFHRTSIYLSAILLAFLDVGTMFANDYSVNLGLAAIEQSVYGFYSSVTGIALTLSYELPVMLARSNTGEIGYVAAVSLCIFLSMVVSVVFYLKFGHLLGATEGTWSPLLEDSSSDEDLREELSLGYLQLRATDKSSVFEEDNTEHMASGSIDPAVSPFDPR